MGSDSQLARLLAAAVHHEILSARGARPKRPSKSPYTWALPVPHSISKSTSLESAVMNLQPLVRPTQLFLLAHALGGVHDRCVEPAGAGGVFHQMPPVVHPAHLAIGADDAVAHVVAVAALHLLADGRADPFPIVGMHDALERIARKRAELLGIRAPEQAHEPRAHPVDRAGAPRPCNGACRQGTCRETLAEALRDATVASAVGAQAGSAGAVTAVAGFVSRSSVL